VSQLYLHGVHIQNPGLNIISFAELQGPAHRYNSARIINYAQALVLTLFIATMLLRILFGFHVIKVFFIINFQYCLLFLNIIIAYQARSIDYYENGTNIIDVIWATLAVTAYTS